MTNAKRSDAAIKSAENGQALAKSGQVLALAALVYTPIAVVTGFFGMNLGFIPKLNKTLGGWAFAVAVLVCYTPFMRLIWELYGRSILEWLSQRPSRVRAAVRELVVAGPAASPEGNRSSIEP